MGAEPSLLRDNSREITFQSFESIASSYDSGISCLLDQTVRFAQEKEIALKELAELSTGYRYLEEVFDNPELVSVSENDRNLGFDYYFKNVE